ncbi:MAG: YicC family protein [Gammaproteobacteria bacterium]|nr:YicC family protein [Gammaproteobacteria bacterium]MDE2345353.1 YicC family protein [Gammaproteobacteria bacterium]
MIRSMTGFARGESRGHSGGFTWELRTVNHRYLDISLRLPEELRGLEPECRERIAATLRRGKVDGQLRFDSAAGADSALELDENRARAITQAAERVAGLLQKPAPISSLELLRWPGVVKDPRTDVQLASDEALQLLDEVLARLADTRVSEGRRIAGLLDERARMIKAVVAEIRRHTASLNQQMRSKLYARFEELKLSVDEHRIEQELVLLLQRLDVTEELDRIDSHLTEFAGALKSGDAVGRRLDFLMQEFNREANTLGSKCQDAAITKQVVELKVLIEQMREQVQNVE